MNKNLDEYQKRILEIDGNIKIIAGAGSGKTFSLLQKIKDLIENKNIGPEKILMISFTNATVDDVLSKMKYNVEVLTFHKLAIKILDHSKFKYQLISDKSLKYIIEEYLYTLSNDEKKDILNYFNYEYNYSRFMQSSYFNSFKSLISKYINLLKSYNYPINELKNIKFSKKERRIIIIILKIYNIYREEKVSTNSLDLDDLLLYATESVEKANLKYDYIIIDEFQDTSFLRFNLIYKIAQYGNSKMIIVGDDWQSIYRFTGCDLNIFLNFDNYIQPLETIKLEKNYRNSNEILKISKIFIEKNITQIQKNLHSNNFLENPVVFIPYSDHKNELKKLLNYHIKTEKLDVMILSRNNNDIIEYIDNDIKIENEEIIFKGYHFKYMTIHKSKGLESDNVILLNCNNSHNGFPNKIEDDIIINKTFAKETMKYAEERRLMYVALTRTKNYIFLLYNKKNPSMFIKELKKIIKKLS